MGWSWLRCALVEAAQATARSNNTYLAARFRRLAARRGARKAAVAAAHTIFVLDYRLQRQEQDCADLGPAYFDERAHSVVGRRVQRRLERPRYRTRPRR